MAGPNFSQRPFRLPELGSLRATVASGAGPESGSAAMDPAEWALECFRGEAVSGERLRIAGESFVVKRDALAGSARRRHGLRRALLRQPPPRVAELRFLDWLKERLFHVPEPAAAVVLWDGWKPARQMLVTRELAGAVPLGTAWETAGDPGRSAWARELGEELGRMHALRFLHADLYPRNVLVTRPAADADVAGSARGIDSGYGRRLAFIDAWAGGPTAWRHGSFARLERDLGAFFSVATDWMSVEHQRLLLDAYAGARAANGRPIHSPDAWSRRVTAARYAEWTRLRDAPGRLRGRTLPSPDWSVPPRRR